MTDDAYLYLLLIVKILVIVHFARDKGICTQADGIVLQKIACPATDSNFTDRPAQ